MSLKFGIYLVEQRIITPEQFCGLVKVQQEAMMSTATIAIRRNVLTINQVARIMDIQEESPEKTFIQVAIENDLMNEADANFLQRTQELTCPKIRKLVVECGLLAERQAAVLFHHFERLAANPIGDKPKSETPKRQIESPAQSPKGVGPRAPKFQQKPVIVNPYSENAV